MSAGARQKASPDERCESTVIHVEKVEALRGRMPGEALLRDASAFFKVMGDNTRFQILLALDQEELCVCDISSLLQMSMSAVSHQLRRLREHKLVKSRREGRMVYYAIADGHVHMMLQGCVDHAREENRSQG